MDLSTISTEDLQKELDSRKEDQEETEQHDAYIGIIDDYGMESLIEVDAKKFASLVGTLQLRARYNGQRNAMVYFVKLPKWAAEKYNENPDYIEAAESLKQLPNFKVIF